MNWFLCEMTCSKKSSRQCSSVGERRQIFRDVAMGDAESGARVCSVRVIDSFLHPLLSPTTTHSILQRPTTSHKLSVCSDIASLKLSVACRITLGSSVTFSLDVSQLEGKISSMISLMKFRSLAPRTSSMSGGKGFSDPSHSTDPPNQDKKANRDEGGGLHRQGRSAEHTRYEHIYYS